MKKTPIEFQKMAIISNETTVQAAAADEDQNIPVIEKWNRRISSDKEELDILHSTEKWYEKGNLNQ